MAIGHFDTDRAIALGTSVAYAYHLYDVDTGNNDQFPDAKLPDKYEVRGNIFVNASLLDKDIPSSRRDALTSIFNLDNPIGFIAVNDDVKDIIEGIRGTQTAFEWIHDGEFLKTDYSFMPNAGRTEFGFTSLYANCKMSPNPTAPRIVDALQEIINKRPGEYSLQMSIRCKLPDTASVPRWRRSLR